MVPREKWFSASCYWTAKSHFLSELPLYTLRRITPYPFGFIRHYNRLHPTQVIFPISPSFAKNFWILLSTLL